MAALPCEVTVCCQAPTTTTPSASSLCTACPSPCPPGSANCAPALAYFAGVWHALCIQSFATSRTAGGARQCDCGGRAAAARWAHSHACIGCCLHGVCTASPCHALWLLHALPLIVPGHLLFPCAADGQYSLATKQYLAEGRDGAPERLVLPCFLRA